MTYTLDELKVLWKGYTSVSGIAALRDGKWVYNFKGQSLNRIENATRAKTVKLSEVMEFPEFLEKYGKE